MKTLIIVEICGKDVSSRNRAAGLRLQIVADAAAQKVRLDFAGVRTVSESFADELFGVLIEDYGEQWFREHVEVANLSDLSRETVLDAIAHRLHLAA
jgi:hypothetical protein